MTELHSSGMAATEFALVLPVMLVLFFGVVEVSMALSCRADVTNVAATAADLTAQSTAMSGADVTNVFNAANALLYPYDASQGRIVITSVVYDSTTKSLTTGNVDWSCASTGSGRSGTVTLPNGLLTAGGSVIMAEVTYNYAPSTTLTVAGTLPMSNTFYTKPRRAAKITGPSSCP